MATDASAARGAPTVAAAAAAAEAGRDVHGTADGIAADATSSYELLDDGLACRSVGDDADADEALLAHTCPGRAADDAVPYDVLPAHSPRVQRHPLCCATGGTADAESGSGSADDEACSVQASSESSDDVISGLLYERADLSLRVAELEAMRDAWEAKVTQLTADNAVLKAAAVAAAQPGRCSSGDGQGRWPGDAGEAPGEASRRIEHLLSENDQLESRLTEMTAEVAAVHCQNKILQVQLSSGSSSNRKASDDSERVQLLADDQPNSLGNADVLEPLAPLVQHQALDGWEGPGNAISSAAGGAPDRQLQDLQALVAQQAAMLESLHKVIDELREQNDVWESRVTTCTGENAVLVMKVKGLEATLANHRQKLAASAAAKDADLAALHLHVLDGMQATQQQLRPGSSASPSVQQHVLLHGVEFAAPGPGLHAKQLPANGGAAKVAAALQMMWADQLHGAEDAAAGDWEIQAATLNADIRSISSSGNSTTSAASIPQSIVSAGPRESHGAAGERAAGYCSPFAQPRRAVNELSDQLTAGQLVGADLRWELQSLHAQCTGLSDSIADIDQLVSESMSCLSVVQQHAKLL